MDWTSLNQNISEISKALGEHARQRQMFAAQKQFQRQKFQDELELLKAKATVENQIKMQDPIAQFLKKAEIARAIKDMSETGMDVSKYQGMFQEGSGQTFQKSNIEEPSFEKMSSPAFNQNNIVREIPSNLIVQEYTRTPFGTMQPGKFTDISAVEEIDRRKELAKGIQNAQGGTVTLAKESLKNIDDVIRTLFPSEQPKSFKRGVAFGSNLPTINLPFIGPITPKMLPIRSKEMQDVFRKTGTSLAGRQLIQTGVAARADETENLRQQFAGSLTSNPESTLEGLKELQNFYKTYLYIVETKGLQSADEWAKSQKIPGNVIGQQNISNMPSNEDIQKAKIQGYTHYNTDTGEWLR